MMRDDIFTPGRVVRAVAGHDKDRFYMVVKLSESGVYIADGKLRKLDKPKRKNPKHLRKTNTILDPESVTTDKKLRLALLPFNSSKAACGEGEGGS